MNHFLDSRTKKEKANEPKSITTTSRQKPQNKDWEKEFDELGKGKKIAKGYIELPINLPVIIRQIKSDKNRLGWEYLGTNKKFKSFIQKTRKQAVIEERKKMLGVFQLALECCINPLDKKIKTRYRKAIKDLEIIKNKLIDNL